MKQVIYPSIVAKNQKELNKDLSMLNGIRTLHLDIVDGRFAPNHSLSFKFKLFNNFNYQAHLMIKMPELWIEKNLKRIDLFIPHFEEVAYPELFIKQMKKLKKKVAFAILPETSARKLRPYAKDIDLVLILTVHPGFYGSRYLPQELKKISLIKKLNPKIKVIVDGGMNPQTIKEAAKAGADLYVSGSYIVKNSKPKHAIRSLMQAIKH